VLQLSPGGHCAVMMQRMAVESAPQPARNIDKTAILMNIIILYRCFIAT
jgi:hypothetical protein